MTKFTKMVVDLIHDDHAQEWVSDPEVAKKAAEHLGSPTPNDVTLVGAYQWLMNLPVSLWEEACQNGGNAIREFMIDGRPIEATIPEEL